MAKIVLLMPALMVDNNRKVNYEAMLYALKNYKVDSYVVYDQEFKEKDYLKGFEYIGHQAERQGFVKPRNELLKYFYNSDYDYAIWFDANEKVTQSSLNDIATVLKNIREDKVNLNAMMSTLGIWISPERMAAKQSRDYFKSVYLVRNKKGYEWMHGLIIKNFKKYYNHEIYIDERCDPRKGTSEDVYFIRLLQRLVECYLCPTVVVSKPSNRTSTWMNNEKGYSYPPIDYPIVDEYIAENIGLYKGLNADKIESVIKLDRIKDDNLQYLKAYKPRGKSSYPKPAQKKLRR